MILIDPDLETDPTPRKFVAAQLTVSPRPPAPWPQRIPTKPTLTRFLTQAQQAVRLRGEVNVLLTTDHAIRRLNHQFRHKNKPTDVLSFPPQDLVQNEEKIAGDLAISVETARRQAADQGHALTCELKILILHGLLHLAGHDHESDTGQMASREQKLRAILRLPQGLIERTTTKAVILSDRSVAKGVEGPAFLDLNPARKSERGRRPGAPSFPRPHAERVGNHKSQPRKQQTLIQKTSPIAGGRP